MLIRLIYVSTARPGLSETDPVGVGRTLMTAFAKQLRGTAEKRQVDGARAAIADAFAIGAPMSERCRHSSDDGAQLLRTVPALKLPQAGNPAHGSPGA